jgi:hypothetical protein
MKTGRILRSLLGPGSVATWLFAFALTAQATDYYVSNSGNDGNNGTSTGTAWKTLAKVNATTFVAGDTISLERGGVWREKLSPTSQTDGTAGNPVIFQAYGSGAKPKILGSDPLVNSLFVLDQGTTYKYTTPFYVDRHTTASINGVPTPYVGFGSDPATLTTVRATPGSSCVDDHYPTTGSSSDIYINTGGSDPRTDGKVYCVAQRQDLIHLNGNLYITIRDLAVSECMGIESYYGVRIEWGHDIRLERCEASWVGAAHFGIIGTANVVCDSLLADSAMHGQTYIGNSAFLAHMGATVLFNNCVATNLQCGGTYANYNALYCYPSTVLVSNMVSIGAGAGGIGTGGGGILTMKGGLFDNAQVEQYGNSSLFDGVRFRGSSWFNVWGMSNTYQNIVMDNITPPQAGAFYFRDGAGANTIRFCTVKLYSGQPLLFAGTSAGTKWYGNIMVGSTTITDAGNTGDFTGTDYNFYPNSPTFNWGGTTFATWKAAGLDTHSLTGDPSFNYATASDYTLQAGSLCRDAATGVPVTVSPDAAGVTRPQGSAPDMGAFEYGGAPAVPVITSATTANGIVGQTFNYQITASGNPTNYGVTGSLPAGLSLTASTGVISGTPTQGTTNTVTISAIGAGGTGSTNLTISISVPAAPVITSPTTANGTTGQAFSYQITASGSPTNYGVTGTLPTGLSLNTSSGLINGTPSQAATNTVTIRATGAGGTGSASLTITITAPAAPVITSPTTTNGILAQPFTYQITASGGPTNYGVIGSLPAGLSLNTSSGLISGTPSQVGTNTVTISATGVGGTGSASLTITITQLAPGHVFYVSPTGNDTNDGKSPSAPWKTVAKVNSVISFVPGDMILFQRGGEWRESIAPNCSGSPTAPIIFDAYDSGAKPKFWGSVILTNANFSTAGGNNYTYSIAGLQGDQIYVLQNNQFLGTGPATYASPTLTITSSTDPRSDGKLYTVCVRGNVIGNNYRRDLTFRNLVADETAGQIGGSYGSVMGFGIRMENATNILIEDCEAYHCGAMCCGIINVDGFVGRRINCGYPASAVTNGGSGIFQSYADGSAPAAACRHQWIDCVSAQPVTSAGVICNALTANGSNLGAISLQGFHANSKVSLGPTATIKGGIISSNGYLEVWGPGSVVDGVTFHDSAGIDQWGFSATIQNCLFDLTPVGSGSLSAYTAIYVRGGATNHVFRFNTFYSAGNYAFVTLVSTGAMSQLYGNMLINPGGYQIFSIWSGIGMGPTDFTYCDYNFYTINPQFQIQWVNKDFTTWKSYGYDAHALTGNPQFKGVGDYRLQPASPAVDAANVGAGRTPATDFLGIIRPQGSLPDIGAYEYSTAPTGSTTIASCGKAPGSGGIYMTWVSAPGATYAVQTSTNLFAPWVNVADSAYTNLAGSGGTIAYTNAISDFKRYYRLVIW